MGSRWEFATATRIVFGRGVAREAAEIGASLGRRIFVVTGRTQARVTWLLEALQHAGAQSQVFAVAGEPDVPLAVEATARARRMYADVVIAVGGGSAIDLGKAVAALAANPGDVLDYLEVVGRGLPLRDTPLPFVAVPTTAGTGSEVTRNAVLAVPDRRVKVSLRSPRMLPRAAVVDPELTDSLPPDTTAYTGLDALTQNLEPFVSTRATPLTDPLCVDGIRRAARSLRAAYRQGDNLRARDDMAMASLCGGLALANAGLGAVHGLAGPIGGMFAAPHGAVCAALLPHVFHANAKAIAERAPGSDAAGRMTEAARLLTGDTTAAATDGADWLTELVGDLTVPGLSSWGLTPADIPAIVDQAARSSSMGGNPVRLRAEELAEVMARAL
jgi:alcohol dehydrogenase class IV